MLSNESLRTWLKTKLDGKYIQGPRIPDVAGAYVLVSGLTGAGFDSEYVIDRPGVQLRTAGRSLHPEEAEATAFELDRIMVRQEFPITIDGTRIIVITRSGGAPAPLETDPEDRTIYVCSYIIHQAA